MRDLTTQSHIDEVLGASSAVLLKYGETCPISRAARGEIAVLSRRLPDLTVGGLEVTSNRALADSLAEDLGVEHQSPQAFVIRNGAVTWHATHYEITAEAMARQLAD